MTKNYAGILAISIVLLLAGCQQTSIAEQEEIRNRETIVAGTPTVTPSPTATPTSTPTTTPSPTVGPTATPTVTPLPTPSPFPPTPTPNPELADFSFCTQSDGDTSSGRFSARLTGITTTIDPAFERIELAFSVPEDSVAPHATARCVTGAGSLGGISAPFVLQVGLDDWLQDAEFDASVLTQTIELSGTTAIKSASFQVTPNRPTGATLNLGLNEPLPFHLAIESSPTRLVIEVARTSPLGPASDMLTAASGTGVSPDAPLYYLKDGDIWVWNAGKEENLTDSPEVETAFATHSDAGKIAFCRAAPGAVASDALAASTLWLMNLDGSDAEEIAAAGQTCAEPVFSPDGKTIAFTVNDSVSNPPRLSIYTVPVAGGDAEQMSAVNDEWSRFGPQWISDTRLVYVGQSEDGRNTLFSYDLANQREEDYGEDLVVGDRYRALGRPLTGPDGTIAVEALRASSPGADLVLLNANGSELRTIGGVYWVRPVAWNADGTLYYLTSTCASDILQNYELYAHADSGDNRLIATGTTLGGFGAFTATENGLAYVSLDKLADGARGPLDLSYDSSSALWFWDVAGGPRAELVTSQGIIGTVTQ